MLSATNAMLCWTPGTTLVGLVPWPDHAGWSRLYRYHDFACWDGMGLLSTERRRAYVLATALQLITRDGCPAYAVHNALLSLDEYVSSLAEDARWPMSKG